MNMKKIRVTIWHEYGAEKLHEVVSRLYPEGQHKALADMLMQESDDFDITVSELSQPELGLPDNLLENTDVLVWWSHFRHDMVPDDLCEKIMNRVRRDGMGFIALHSSHGAKPFDRLVGSTGSMSWGTEVNEVLWMLLPSHPIAKDIPLYIHLPSEEIYSEPFCIGHPDEVIFGGWFETGHFLRAGVTFQRGLGKVFYFQPGHETCESYYNKDIVKIIANSIRWAAPTAGFTDPGMPMIGNLAQELGITTKPDAAE